MLALLLLLMLLLLLLLILSLWQIELSAEEGGIDGSEGFDGCATE